MLLGRYVVELELDRDARLLKFKFYVENAVSLLQQVRGMYGQLSFRVSWLFPRLDKDLPILRYLVSIHFPDFLFISSFVHFYPRVF